MSVIQRVAIQGDRASFHEIAAHKYYKESIELLYCDTFQEVFELLRHGSASQAFVAVHNSTHGVIHEVETLISQANVHIEGRHPLRIDQHLIVHPDATLDDIRTVLSHPVALSQCDVFLARLDRRVQSYHDTSAAVEYVRQSGDRTLAAIGSEVAATLHGMKILKWSIQNDQRNTTTFASLRILNNS